MAVDPKSYAYKGRPNAEYQRFKEEYYSGQDARIYFGNVWVDEVVDFRFQLVENVAPIFGYASYTWDAVAHGNRQIQGSFRINFKESYYLHSIINQLDYEMSRNTDGPIGNTKVPTNKITPSHMKSNIESLFASNEFDKLATEFEKSLWGESTNSSMQARSNERGKQGFFYPENSKKNIVKNGLSIVLLYGPYKESFSPSMTNEKVATTSHTITGVHLTGVSQVIDGSGQPVYEDYSFIARDLDSNANLMSAGPQYRFGEKQ